MKKIVKKSYKLSKDLTQIYGENRILVDKLREIVDFLKEKYGLSENEILDIIKERTIAVPVSIFNNKLAPLEALVLYLKKHLNYKFSEIALMLNRDQSTIWLTYQNSLKKKVRIEEKSEIFIPLEIFSDRKLSILENITEYLRDKGLSLKEIAKLVGKDNRTIWTVYNRAKKKRGKR